MYKYRKKGKRVVLVVRERRVMRFQLILKLSLCVVITAHNFYSKIRYQQQAGLFLHFISVVFVLEVPVFRHLLEKFGSEK